MAMTIEKLKKILEQYPDETLIYICDNNYSGGSRDITSVNIEYVSGDDYQLPQITLS